MKKEEIINSIEKAFSQVQCPPDEKFLHPDCHDDMDIRSFYGKDYKSWKDIEADIIEYENAALCFTSPELFQFLLPAYMIQGINNPKVSKILDNTIYSLELNDVFKKNKFSLFTRRQKETVISFLVYCIQSINEFCDSKVAEKALTYWKK